MEASAALQGTPITAAAAGGSATLLPFADRYAPADRALTPGTQLPCGSAKVQSAPLAALLISVALWDLRERGALTMEAFDKKVLFRTQRKVGLRRAAPTGELSGLEGALLRTVSDSGPDANAVDQVVWRFLGRDSNEPYKPVIATVVQHLASLGYYREVDAQRGAVTGFVLGKTRLEPDCDKVAGLRPAFDGLAERWEAFAQADAELHKRLLDAASAGIRSRKDTSDD